MAGFSASPDMLQGEGKVVRLSLNTVIASVKRNAPAKSLSREKTKKGFKPIFTACAH